MVALLKPENLIQNSFKTLINIDLYGESEHPQGVEDRFNFPEQVLKCRVRCHTE